MAKDFRFNGDGFDRKKQKRQHREMRQNRDNWRNRPLDEKDGLDLVNARDMQRLRG